MNLELEPELFLVGCIDKSGSNVSKPWLEAGDGVFETLDHLTVDLCEFVGYLRKGAMSIEEIFQITTDGVDQLLHGAARLAPVPVRFRIDKAIQKRRGEHVLAIKA